MDRADKAAAADLARIVAADSGSSDEPAGRVLGFSDGRTGETIELAGGGGCAVEWDEDGGAVIRLGP